MVRRAVTEVCGSGAFAVDLELDAATPRAFRAVRDYSMTFPAFHGPFQVQEDDPCSPGVWESCELPLPQLHDELLPSGTLQWCGAPIADD